MIGLAVHVFTFGCMPAELWVFLLAIAAWFAVAVPVAVTIGRLARLRDTHPAEGGRHG